MDDRASSANCSDPGDLAASIRDDFRALVDVLAQQAERIDGNDAEILAHIGRARNAAERGLQLSERLMRVANSAHEQSGTKA